MTSDFQCPACRTLALEVLPEIRKEFVEPGLARLAFVSFPQDRYFNSRFAALAALCAGRDGRFWEVHDSLFANQSVWERMPDPRPYMDSLAVSAGAEPGKQGDCSEHQRLAPLLGVDIERALKSGATDVPTVFVGDRQLRKDELSVRGIRRAVRGLLGER